MTTEPKPLTGEEEAQMRQLVAYYQRACASSGNLFPEEEAKSRENIEWAEGEIGSRVVRLFATIDAEREKREAVERENEKLSESQNCKAVVRANREAMEIETKLVDAERELGELKAALREAAHLSFGQTSVKDILHFAAKLAEMNQSVLFQPRLDAARLLLAVLEPGEGE